MGSRLILGGTTMAIKRAVDEIIRILGAGHFDALIGSIEDASVEVKGSPYLLSAGDWSKQELAKDVSALANANGGNNLFWFPTSKDARAGVEYIDGYRPFDLALIDADQYRKVLQDWIYPPVHAVEVVCYPDLVSSGKGAVAIMVPPEVREGKPYVVTRSVEPDGKVRGTLIG